MAEEDGWLLYNLLEESLDDDTRPDMDVDDIVLGPEPEPTGVLATEPEPVVASELVLTHLLRPIPCATVGWTHVVRRPTARPSYGQAVRTPVSDIPLSHHRC
jgi:hypothetical protein